MYRQFYIVRSSLELEFRKIEAQKRRQFLHAKSLEKMECRLVGNKIVNFYCGTAERDFCVQKTHIFLLRYLSCCCLSPLPDSVPVQSLTQSAVSPHRRNSCFVLSFGNLSSPALLDER